MVWTTDGLIAALYIAVAIMLIVVLYHVLFIVVDLRRITRRIEGITEQVEAVILKPLSMADKGFEWVMGLIEERSNKNDHHKKE